MTSIQRRGFLALGGLAAGSLAAPAILRAQSLTNIADTLAGDTRFSNFLNLIVHASAQQNLREAGPFTLFAPVDAAFNNAPAAVLQDIRTLGQQRGSGGQSSGDSSDRDRWIALINYHVVPGAFQATDFQGASRRLRTLNGADVEVGVVGGGLQVQNPAPSQQVAGLNAPFANAPVAPAQVLGSPTVASNGVIYPISQVLFP
jgi:uncharacterized surface protein with fasciclin (FAS1) repeats